MSEQSDVMTSQRVMAKAVTRPLISPLFLCSALAFLTFADAVSFYLGVVVAARIDVGSHSDERRGSH